MEITYIEGIYVGQRFKPGIRFPFQIAVPVLEAEEYAVLVEHDGLNDANVRSMYRLAEEGKAPPCVCIGIHAGSLPMSDGTERRMRMNNYDLFDGEYGDLVIRELIPYISKTYSIRFSDSPDMHFVSGGSSGGISAFVMAWLHPGYFHRVYMSSPSFLAMGRGNEIPYLVRKYEGKPLRIYQEYSENEPNDYFGWSRGIDAEAEKALQFAGYDFQCAYFPNEGHCSRYRDESEAYKRNEWIWRGWSREAISAASGSARLQKVIPEGSKWQRCDRFPSERLVDVVPSGLKDSYDVAVLSNDGLAWYVGNRDEDHIYMIVGEEAEANQKRLVHAMLHTVSGYMPRGAIDLTVDRCDRLYVLTAIGIQCVRSFGLIDVILELPDDSEPLEIAVTDALYVRTVNGIYRRILCEDCVTQGEHKRKQVSYYD